jgi:hypothetical protein
MSSSVGTPRVSPGGLVTIAFLKAQLDGNNDHIGIFMPLVNDAICHIKGNSFTTIEIQDQLLAIHGISMPQQVVLTLLKRATAARALRREDGRYLKISHDIPTSNLKATKAELEAAQNRLGAALQAHAAKRGLSIASIDEAVDMLIGFLEAEQIGMLLGSGITPSSDIDVNNQQTRVIAEFVQIVVKDDAALSAVLQRMIEGLVLYHAAFLPDLNAATQKFKNLRVVFDSSLVRKALGYEGDAMKMLMRETLGVLKGAGVQCLVFDKTLEEIHRILKVFEQKLATTAGQQALRPSPMARNFLIQRYAPSDIREMSALLEAEIQKAGFQVMKLPQRKYEHTAGEKELISRLATPGSSKDDIEPRVAHDVDCVAGVLQLREGVSSNRLEDARAVFAADQNLVIKNTRLWWRDDENQTGIEPVVHIRGLTNLAWLKKPTLNIGFKIKELIALCSAALQPSQKTWIRFLKHLDSLVESKRITSDEMTAILVSAMSDSLLRDAENPDEDPDDIDAVTLDQIVDRVKTSYAADAESKIRALKETYDQEISQSREKHAEAVRLAEKSHLDSIETSTRNNAFIEDRANSLARIFRIICQIIANIVLLAGATAIIREHPIQTTLVGIGTLCAVVVFVLLEFVALRSHVSSSLTRLEIWARGKIVTWLSPPEKLNTRGEFTD